MGLKIFDISDPIKPIYTGGYYTAGMPSGIAIQECYAFVADFYNGLVIIDITNPTEPKFSGGFETGWAYEITIRNHYAFVAVTWVSLS